VDVAAPGSFLNNLNRGSDWRSAGSNRLIGQAFLKADAECAAGRIVQAMLDHQHGEHGGRGNGDHPDYMAAAWQCVTSQSDVSAEWGVPLRR
jgi:hypothetical protein